MRIFKIVLALLFTSSLAHAKDIDLSRCTIFLEENCSASQRYAAQELSNYVYKITGREINIAPAAITNSVRLFIKTKSLGDDFGDDGFSIEAKSDVLTIKASRKRGALYAVYELLERFGGVRWYSSNFEKVPKANGVLVQDGFSTVQKPDFQLRSPFWYDVHMNAEFAARLRVYGPGHENTAQVYGDENIFFGGGLGPCHTFDKLCPAKKYFIVHPEYFSFVDGKRLGERTQLCLTNKDVLEIVSSNVLERIRRSPNAKFFGISQNDYYNYCECQECAAIDGEEGSQSGTLIRFINAIAERVAKEFPDVVIETLAYQYTRKPPRKTRPAKNVLPCLCPYECDFSHSISNGWFVENIKFRRDLARWAEISSQLMIWDYSTNFRHYPQIFPDAYALAENIKLYRDNSARMIFFNASYQGYGAYFEELKAWLQAKLTWNADLDVKELMDDFFCGFYGKAAKLIREDFEEAHSYFAERPTSNLSINDPLNLSALPQSYFKKSLERRCKALKIAEVDKRFASNVRKWAMNVAYTCFFRLAMKMPESELTKEDKALRTKLADELYEYSKSVGAVRWCESASLNNQRFLLIMKHTSLVPQEDK